MQWSNGGQTPKFFREQTEVQQSRYPGQSAPPALSVTFQLANHQAATDPMPGGSTLLDGEGCRGEPKPVLPCSKEA